jgi:methylated-DNA-protein-cysteine methyltransferase-like protein
MMGVSEFFQRVYEIVARVPRGKVVTYGQIAAALGDPRQARTVGWALHSAPDWLDIPWHRVVNSSGGISTRHSIAGSNVQRELLEDEGVIFDEDGHLDLERYRWAGI